MELARLYGDGASSCDRPSSCHVRPVSAPCPLIAVWNIFDWRGVTDVLIYACRLPSRSVAFRRVPSRSVAFRRVEALASGASDRKVMGVRVPPSAPFNQAPNDGPS